ncbi:F0F1 ATP synthase subunit delta [Mangrovicoccus sp. HB161399]|uniref:F0F1 ATP synthase subunit delta n=1 Tax=Mangrovicoccus sp. HB161399 TaxID=2720392 RepID=UPI001556EE38|nr:F0F1 ATP synthase subunit delta [Mangrovicoccus sp. HB161399]
MSIDWWTLGLQAVNLLVLVWILARFLFRPVARILAERREAAAAVLADAEAARAAAEAARQEAEAETAALKARREALLAEAREAAGREAEALRAEARAGIGRERAEAEAQIARLRESGQEEAAGAAAALAADIARRLMGRLPDSARAAGFAAGLAEALADLPEATRAGLGVAAPLRIRAARALSEEERRDLRDRLAAVLERPVTLDVAEDPSLLAGLELEAPGAVVRNHLKADLGRIASELARHG